MMLHLSDTILLDVYIYLSKQAMYQMHCIYALSRTSCASTEVPARTESLGSIYGYIYLYIYLSMYLSMYICYIRMLA